MPLARFGIEPQTMEPISINIGLHFLAVDDGQGMIHRIPGLPGPWWAVQYPVAGVFHAISVGYRGRIVWLG